MTFEQYINNPMGKASAVVSAALRETLRKDYTMRFHNILVRENGKIDYYLYKDSQHNTYYIHVKVPSESVKKFYYDVVFKFFVGPDVKDNGRSLNKWDVQFFSNDPAFVYTYAYAYNQNHLFITELAPKMIRQCLTSPAQQKNPTNTVNFAKILFFGCQFINERGLLSTSALGAAEPYNLRLLQSRVTDAERIIREREEEGKKISHRKKIDVDQDTYNKLKRYGVKDDSNRLVVVSKTKKTPTIKKIGAVNSVKKVKKKR